MVNNMPRNKPPPLNIDTSVPPDYMPPKTKRKYSGPEKGSEEAKERMAKVRAAQWAKNNLVVSNVTSDD
jgi:hypothetical protein